VALGASAGAFILTVFLTVLLTVLGGACGVDSGGSRMLGFGGAGGSAPPGQVAVTVDVTQTHQTLVGFGAAVAFYSNLLSVRTDDIYQVLFPDLGLDLLRIANWYQVQPSTGTSTSTPFGDTAGVNIVQKATAALGHPPKILMSSWSPPAYLKSNATTKGSQGTLISANGAYQYDAFAQWWVSALGAYAAQGVVPDYISIQNEPDYYNSGWETCSLDPVEGKNAGYAPALDAVYRAVQASSLASKPTFIGPEVSGIGSGRVTQYLTGQSATLTTGPAVDPTQIGAVAHHLYNGGGGGDDPPPDSFMTPMESVATEAAAMGKPIFMTEFAPNAPTLFDTAWLIHDSLVTEGVAAYFYWDLIWAPPAAGKPPSGLVTIASGAATSSYTINDIYYAVKHFSKWTDPGWTRVEATSDDSLVNVSAFQSPDGASLTVIILNGDTADETVTIDPGSFAFSTTDAFRTSGTTERTAEMPLGAGGTIVIPSKGIATVTFTP
jgi:glucuronoarabinoxylan endo-1,4-beta-xylanase